MTARMNIDDIFLSASVYSTKSANPNASIQSKTQTPNKQPNSLSDKLKDALNISQYHQHTPKQIYRQLKEGSEPHQPKILKKNTLKKMRESADIHRHIKHQKSLIDDLNYDEFNPIEKSKCIMKKEISKMSQFELKTQELVTFSTNNKSLKHRIAHFTNNLQSLIDETQFLCNQLSEAEGRRTTKQQDVNAKINEVNSLKKQLKQLQQQSKMKERRRFKQQTEASEQNNKKQEHYLSLIQKLDDEYVELLEQKKEAVVKYSDDEILSNQKGRLEMKIVKLEDRVNALMIKHEQKTACSRDWEQKDKTAREIYQMIQKVYEL